MRKKLHDQMVQKVDDEDERIAKALAEREAKREVNNFQIEYLISSYCWYCWRIFMVMG